MITRSQTRAKASEPEEDTFENYIAKAIAKNRKRYPVERSLSAEENSSVEEWVSRLVGGRVSMTEVEREIDDAMRTACRQRFERAGKI